MREKGGKCPSCNFSNILHYPNKELEGGILQLEVRCANKKCGWKGPLKEYDSHLNSNPADDKWLEGCKEVTVRCIYCRTDVKKREDLLKRLEYRFFESKVDSVYNITCSNGICAKWHDIGMGLGLEATVLQAISLIHRSKPEECYRGMLKEWIDISESANWKKLLEVFREPTVNFKVLATKIKQNMNFN